MSLGFWSKSKKNTAGGGGANPLKVDAIFATDDSGSMNSYLAWEDDPGAISAFNTALSDSGIGAKNLEIVDDNNANRISRTFFATYKQQVISNLYLVRITNNLSSASIALGATFTIKRGGVTVGSANDYVIYSWYNRKNTYDSNIVYNELIFQSATGGAGVLADIQIGDSVEDVNGTSYGTVTYTERLDNPYLYYVSGDKRLRYFWAKKAGNTGSYVKNSSNGAPTGANSEDAYGIIHKTIGVNLNGSTQQDGTVVYDDFKPRASSKLVFVANTNEHDTAIPYNLDSTRNLLLQYNGVYIGNIGGAGVDVGVGIFPHIRQAFDYNGGTNGVPSADPRGFQPIADYVSDIVVESITPSTSLNSIPNGWYRGVEFEIKDVESTTSSSAVQARHRPKIRVDIKVDTPVGESNKTLTLVKVVFPGYGYVVGDTLTPPAITGSLFGSLHDKLILKVARTKDIDYSSASKKIFAGVYTKDYNRMVFLNQVGPVTAFDVFSAGTGYSPAASVSTFYEVDQASGFNNAGDGTGLIVDITAVSAAGAITSAIINAGGSLYSVGDKVIVTHPSPGTITALNSGSLVGGSGYGASQTVTNASFGNVSDLAVGAGGTCNYVTNASGAITSVTLVSGGLNYQSGDVVFIQGGNDDAQITIGAANKNAILEVTGVAAEPELRERAYLVRDINLITRGNNNTSNEVIRATGSQPQTGGVREIAANQFTVTTTASSNKIVVTGTGAGAALSNLSIGDEIWNAANTTANGTKTGLDLLTLSPTIPWDVKVTGIDTNTNTITMSAAANSSATGVTAYIGTRNASSTGWRWDHTTLARETGGAIFFQVGPFGTLGSAPSGVAYWDNSRGNATYGAHDWETVSTFGRAGSGADYRIQFGRTIGKTVGEYLFKTA